MKQLGNMNNYLALKFNPERIIILALFLFSMILFGFLLQQKFQLKHNKILIQNQIGKTSALESRIESLESSGAEYQSKIEEAENKINDLEDRIESLENRTFTITTYY